MPVAGPWYFAWVDEGTAFNPAVHNVMDEYIFSLKRVLKEGDKPTLELVIRNPHIGLLNGARKQWAWLSRFNGTSIVPIFYGRLIAAPKDLFKELMTLNLIAWPTDYNVQRQKLAEQIKLTGPYDPVFIEITKRDDPDTILEAVSGLYHIDPVTHVVTISDILNGEDGNVNVSADQHLYDEMQAEFDQAHSINAILMVAEVTWNQTGQGSIDMGAQSITTYAGDSVISEWPKPPQSLGGGYTVIASNAADAAGVNATVTASAVFNWTNREKEHSDGDQLSVSDSVTMPVGFNAGAKQVLSTFNSQPGLLDPFAVDGDGDPSPSNIPPHLEAAWIYCPLWVVNTSLVLTYRDLERQRTERIQMLLQSDLQSIIFRPEDVEQTGEVIQKQGADIGVPVVNLLNWTTIAGTAVALNTVVFPAHPTIPSLRTAQIAVVAGTAGVVEPNFSDVPGATTVDNTVTWASMGTQSPVEGASDWTANSPTGLGTVILPRRRLSITTQALTAAGLSQVPPVGTNVGAGQVLDNNRICTLSGIIASPTGDSATFLSIINPDGKTHYICVQAGKTGADFNIPPFNTTLHARTTDGSVIWASIGPGDIPAGGTTGDVWARSYFDTARGNKSIAYLIEIMRARARLKARAVTADFTPIDPFGLGLTLTLRKTVALVDTRLGGGIATGKAIYIEHSCDGHTGRERCHAQIGCAIGKDNVITPLTGTASYSGVYAGDYEVFIGAVVTNDTSDVGYSVPLFSPDDDGLVFPLTKSQVVISEGIKQQGDQAAAVDRALKAMAEAAVLSQRAGGSGSLDYSAQLQQQIRALSVDSVQNATQSNPIWYDAVLRPLTGWQFNNAYTITLTKLTCQKGIDLGGASTP